ncbi:MAG: polyphosphate polymerase domain-containing protein [Blautia sp.]|nr:polyphosphate polymerase domain-containing protein [Lachnoclostridium sp.]MCM1212671.1 polyphosphate polymerase domain-containing protein [Blautia sp.]
MDYRHEWKIEINAADYLSLRTRLQAVMKQDTHAIDGKYFIRSLYFDDSVDSALRDKIDGVNRREKFRIRYYNKDTSFICLEKKSKLNSLCNKQSAQITEKEAQAIVDGNFAWIMDSSIPLLQELYCKIKTNGLRPKTVVDYIREPFTYKPGNVRVTLDYNIRTSISCTDFLNTDCVTIPAGDAPILMEVKWDAFLPDIIRDTVWLPGRRAAAFSKYAQCRIYG